MGLGGGQKVLDRGAGRTGAAGVEVDELAVEAVALGPPEVLLDQ